MDDYHARQLDLEERLAAASERARAEQQPRRRVVRRKAKVIDMAAWKTARGRV